jgi:thiamine kinase-like enzyme
MQKKFYLHYRSWPVVYDYIRAENCEMPKHLREMLIGVDENAQAIFRRIEKLPVVLCHRDFWVANIFHTQEGTVAIDWDTAGWGYLGEDLASLLADEADVDHVAEYFGRCVPAYHKGFSEYAGIAPPADGCVWELTLLLFGYRLVEEYVTAEGTEDCQEAREQKDRSLRTLEKLYEIKSKTQNPC